MNHGKKIKKNGIKTNLIAFCFIIFFSFSLFSIGLVNSNQSSSYQIDSAIDYSTNSKFSKVAYIENYWHIGESTHFYLVVKDLNTNNSTTYNLCHYTLQCNEIYSLEFYNSSVVIFDFSASTYYDYFNFNTKEIGSFNGFNYVADFLRINSTLFYYYVSTVPDTFNSSQYVLHINLYDILTHNNCSIVLDNYTEVLNPTVTISPDLSKLVIAYGRNVYFYRITDLKAILLQSQPLNITLDGSTNKIQFIQWQNSSFLYYGLDYNSLTQLYSFNYKDRSSMLIHAFNLNYYNIVSFNPENSLIVTRNPYTQIHFLNTTQSQVIFISSLGYPIMESTGSNFIFWKDQEIVLMSFDQATVTFKQLKVLCTVPSNELSLLRLIESINFVITILLAIAILPVSYTEKIWHI